MQANLIAGSQAATVVRDRKTCYEAMLLNQYIVPDFKDKIMTKGFMKKVLKGECWLPKAHEMNRSAVCAFPPTKEVLARTLYEQLIGLNSINARKDAAIRRTAIQIKRKPPCKRWMLQLIG